MFWRCTNWSWTETLGRLAIKKKHLYSLLLFSITPTYFVILNFVFHIISGTSSGRAMLLFIYLVFFYFRNAESRCISMEKQHTGIDNTLAVLAVDVSMDSFCVFFVLSFFKKKYLKRVSLKEIKKKFGIRSPWGPPNFLAIYKLEKFWPFMTFLPSSSYISWRKDLEHRQDPVGLPSVAALMALLMRASRLINQLLKS